MMSMDQIKDIRRLFYEQDKNISEIANLTGYNRKTVTKYVDMDDFSPKAPRPASEIKYESKLDPHKPLIDSWLTADKKAPRKQRHTAKRVFNRLKKEAEDFDCSYRLVAEYVSVKKKELNLKREPGAIPLIHYPGEAQADFGTADFYENGKLHHEAKYFVLSFPYSNGGYLQLCYGENLECLLESMVAIFEYMGGVPTEIWFDNTKTIVTEIIKGGGRVITERFERFCEHYRFRPVFMNPDSGNEKGNVENKVGYLRRNELVPIPQFMDVGEENKRLLSACDDDMDREHYDNEDNLFISELFEKDKAALIPLPTVAFDTAKYTEAPTDNYGKFTLDKGKHRYSASPDFSGKTVRLKITSRKVYVMDDNLRSIICHRRLYGDEYESMEWLPYLKYIAKKPRSLRNSGIYDMMPHTMQKYMDSCANADRGKILKVLSELTERSGFNSAISTVNEALNYSATDSDSLKNLYLRIYSNVPVLPPLKEDAAIPKQKVVPFDNDLSRLDAVLKGGVVNG